MNDKMGKKSPKGSPEKGKKKGLNGLRMAGTLCLRTVKRTMLELRKRYVVPLSGGESGTQSASATERGENVFMDLFLLKLPGGTPTAPQQEVIDTLLRTTPDKATAWSFLLSLQRMCTTDDSLACYIRELDASIGDKEFSHWLISTSTLRVLYSFTSLEYTKEVVRRMHERLRKKRLPIDITSRGSL